MKWKIREVFKSKAVKIVILCLLLFALSYSVVEAEDNLDMKSVTDDQSFNPNQEEQKLLLEKGKIANQIIVEQVFSQTLNNGNYIPTLEDDAAYLIFTMIQSGYEAEEFYKSYYEGLMEELEKQKEPQISVTGWAKLIMLASVMGENPYNMGGHNAIANMLEKDKFEASGEYMKYPTVLLALDMKSYKEPEGESYISRMDLIEFIAEQAISETDLSDIDMMVMNIQPLYTYYNESAKEGDPYFKVKLGVENVFDILTKKQQENGYYNGWGTDNNPWTTTQVMITYGLFGINPLTEDHGFDVIKNGVTVFDTMFEIIDFENQVILPAYAAYDPIQFSRGFTACIRCIEKKEGLFQVSEIVEPDEEEDYNEVDDQEDSDVEEETEIDEDQNTDENGIENDQQDNQIQEQESELESLEESPQTGDEVQIIGWMIVSLISIGTILVVRKKKMVLAGKI